MVNAKAAVLLIAASVLLAAVAGIAFAAYASTQTSSNSASQAARGTAGDNGSASQTPQQGYHPYGAAQNSYPYGYDFGSGRCGCRP